MKPKHDRKVSDTSIEAAWAAFLKEEEQANRESASRYLTQLEDALTRLCQQESVAQTALQLLSERMENIPAYTREPMPRKLAREMAEPRASMTSEERKWSDEFAEELEMSAERDYTVATEAIKQFYMGLSSFLSTAATREHSLFHVGVARILRHWNPEIRFYTPVRSRRKPRR